MTGPAKDLIDDVIGFLLQRVIDGTEGELRVRGAFRDALGRLPDGLPVEHAHLRGIGATPKQ
jgi:hypothetical protein